MGESRWKLGVRTAKTLAMATCLGACTPSPQPQGPAPVSPVASVTASDSPIVEYPAPETSQNVACDSALGGLATADKDQREALLISLRDRCGGASLVAALDVVDKTDADRAFGQTDRVFRMIHAFGDPRAADALADYASRCGSVHWATEAGIALAELGDLRAVPLLASRLTHGPQDLYGQSNVTAERALARDDRERLVAARMLGDLAIMHPDQRADILVKAEDSVWRWLDDIPYPPANAMRFLAAAGSTRALPQMRAWAFPKGKLPPTGAQPPFDEKWVVAQSALRYLGWMRDEPSWKTFEAQLDRRRKEAHDADHSMDALMGGGVALQGMASRALGFGVAEGYAQWGDHRAVPILLRYIENPKENEQSRTEACRDVGLLLDAADAVTVANKIDHLAGSNQPKEQFVAGCLADSLRLHGQPAVQKKLLATFDKTPNRELLRPLARAIGAAPIADDLADSLVAYAADPARRLDAALAVLLGGSPERAERAVSAFLAADPGGTARLAQVLNGAMLPIMEEDLATGRLARRVAVVESLASLQVSGTAQTWARTVVSQALQTQVYEQGPLSVSRPVLLFRLRTALASGAPTEKAQALGILRLLNAPGILAAAGE